MNVTFSGNTANYGGGVLNSDDSPTFTNVTFSGNTANYAGGMYNAVGGPTLTNVTFSGNTAIYGAGGMDNYSDTLTIQNTIFWGNTAPEGAQIYDDSYWLYVENHRHCQLTSFRTGWTRTGRTTTLCIPRAKADGSALRKML
jgi:predicted outer membrane repeat protein